MAFIRFSDHRSDGEPSNVYVYFSVDHNYYMNVDFEAYEKIDDLNLRCVEVEVQDTSTWMQLKYDSLESLTADVQDIAEIIVVPEVTLDRLERRRQQVESTYFWFDKIIGEATTKERKFYDPLDSEKPLAGEEDPFSRQGLRDYLERVVPEIYKQIPDTIEDCWKQRSHIFTSLIDLVLTEYGVNVTEQDPNWYGATVADIIHALETGRDVEYDTFLDEDNYYYFMYEDDEYE